MLMPGNHNCRFYIFSFMVSLIQKIFDYLFVYLFKLASNNDLIASTVRENKAHKGAAR